MSFRKDAESTIIEEIVTSHPSSSYLKREVEGMEFRLSSELSVGEIKLFVNYVILPFMDVWEAVERKVSYPKQCKYSYPIPTAADIKFYTRPFRQGSAKADFLNKYANELLEHGLIEDCNERTCISQAMATHKADAAPGIFRFVTDYRKVNEFTVDDHMGLPFIWDLAYELAGCKWVTELDLASGCWQIGVVWYPTDVSFGGHACRLACTSRLQSSHMS